MNDNTVFLRIGWRTTAGNTPEYCGHLKPLKWRTNSYPSRVNGGPWLLLKRQGNVVSTN